MGVAAFRLEGGALCLGQLQRAALIDPRQLAHLQQRALAFQLGFGLITGIDPARRLQAIESGGVDLQPAELAVGEVVLEAQPVEIAIDGLFKFLRRARRIGIVNSQQEFAAFAAGEKIIEQRGAGIADMQQARGRWREADDDVAHRTSRKALVIG